ncbi:FYVE zinc finger-domain-containing protein [Dichotomocladium elegans]|nr:FYVE zinc finger-domain-containing protein [Dichotomocladium elegans]
MATAQPSSNVAYNYEDYVPLDEITCPICDAPCSSLQALNLHLDAAHTEEDSKGALLSWFRTAHRKVQTTLGSPRSPTSLNSNAVERSFRQLLEPNLMNSFSNFNLGNNNPVFFASDVDRQQSEVITREHWQREGQNDVCSMPGCGRSLGRLNKQHCRQQMKLDRNAQHDPESGIWCRVCAVCFASRTGYIDHRGATRSLTAGFLKHREKVIDRVHLESNRLEKRLEKLARIHYALDTGSKGERMSPSPSLASFSVDRTDSGSSIDSFGSSVMSPRSGFVSNGNSILSMKLKYRDGEQAVTKWQDDKSVTHCPLCASAFTITNRKHHCRLCGRIVCGNTHCSKMIPLFLDMTSDHFDQEPVGDTRACHDCQRLGFRRRLRYEESIQPMAIAQLYQQLMVTRQNIEKLLPVFHDVIVLLDKEKIHKQPKETFQKAAIIRKSLMDNFALFDTLAKRIKALPAKSSSMRRLQSNVCTAASMYLQQNMLPLQMLPRILKPEQNGSSKKLNGGGSAAGHANRKRDLQLQLQAFKEQQMLVEGYVRDAQSSRKFDDVKTLKMSLDELRAEILRIQAELGNF